MPDLDLFDSLRLLEIASDFFGTDMLVELWSDDPPCLRVVSPDGREGRIEFSESDFRPDSAGIRKVLLQRIHYSD